MSSTNHQTENTLPPHSFSVPITGGTSQFFEIVPVTTVTVPPYTKTNAIFFGRTRFIVIDPGSPHDDQRAILKNYIEQRLKNGQHFMGVYITHHHGDHTKAAEFLSEQFRVPIFAHHSATDVLKFQFHPLADDDRITHAGEPVLRALHTPGHADDHMIFYAEDEGILVAGDMITDRGTILIPPMGGSLKIYLESLDLLTHLKLNAIIPAHGEVISNEPTRFLCRAMKHRYDRIKGVFDAILQAQRELDATDITRIVYHNSVADNLMVFAQLSVESSLQWLKEFGLIENPQHLWKASSDAEKKCERILSDRLKHIDDRLRNA